MNSEWSLGLGHMPAPLALVVVVGCVAVALVEIALSTRASRGPRPLRITAALVSLRVVAVLAFLVVAFEVSLRIDAVAPGARRLVVLVDTSASMALADAADPDESPLPRHQRAVAAVDPDLVTGWRADGLHVDIRSFDTTATPKSSSMEQILGEIPVGPASDLAGALAMVAENTPSSTAPLAGIVVISDGITAAGDPDETRLEAAARSVGVPITTVATGAPIIRDVSVADVRAEIFAFVENVAEIEADLVSHGYGGETATVQLRRDGKVVARHVISLGPDGSPTPVRFEVAPDRVGQFVYEIAIPARDGEATIANNSRAFVVKVLRDKVRALHVAGRPDWDVRALRTLLRRDPNVELLSYYILRGFDDIERDDTTPEELSLIPFPTDELFQEQLGSFDMILLHNFDAARHHVGRYMSDLAAYVHDGGALVVIGGDMGLAEAAYHTPEMAEILPINARIPAPIVHESVIPELTDAGRRHPITAWLTGAEGGGWTDLPPLSDFNLLQPSPDMKRIDGVSLLVHPDGDRPLLTVAEPGRGRVMVLGTGSSWRLGFAPDLPPVEGSRPYDLLWLGAVRWLLRDDTTGRLNLETDKPRYRQGEPVELRSTTLTPSYAPEANIEVRWRVRPLADTDDKKAQPVAAETWITDELGRAQVTLDDLGVGAYEAVANRAAGVEDAGDEPMVARRVFLVEPPARELARVQAQPGTDRLRRVADKSGGGWVELATGDDIPAHVPTAAPSDGDGQLLSRREVPLWSNGWALLLVILAFGGEWLLRRRHGDA